MSSPHSWGDAFPDLQYWQGHTIIAIADKLQQSGFRVEGYVNALGVVTLKFFVDDLESKDSVGGSDSGSSDDDTLPVSN